MCKHLDLIHERAPGRWLDILSGLAPDLRPAVDRLGRHVPCPVHGGQDGFRLFRDADQTGGGICNSCGSWHDGIDLLCWINQWRFGECIKAIADYLDHQAVTAFQRPARSEERVSPEQTARRQQRLNDSWAAACRLDHVKAEPFLHYLVNRGLVSQEGILPLLGQNLRVHPCLPYWDQESERCLGRFPALLSAIQDVTGRVVTLHRTYLNKDGHKASVPKPKKLMQVPGDRKLTGSAIRLFPVRGNELGVAEGIETSVAVHLGTGQPVWSCVSAALLAGFVPPEGIEVVHIWADKDRSRAGENAAENLASRLRQRGQRVEIHLPEPELGQDAKSVDWLDVWNQARTCLSSVLY